MHQLTSEIVSELLEACRAGAGEAAAAFGRALGVELEVAVGEAVAWAPAGGPAAAGQKGLLIVFQVGGTGAVVIIPEETGLVPEWVAAPDATGRSRLDTLAQELGATLLPERYFPEAASAAWVEDWAAAVSRGEPEEKAVGLTLVLRQREGKESQVRLVWPLRRPELVLGDAEVGRTAGSDAAGGVPPGSPSTAASGQPRGRVISVDNLPQYARSLLRIKVPVVVTLARKRQPLSRILELGPGAIIQFDKSCEEMLELEVGGRPVATGEAVKVGEKFGLRIHSIVLPEERFRPVRPESQRPR